MILGFPQKTATYLMILWGFVYGVWFRIGKQKSN